MRNFTHFQQNREFSNQKVTWKWTSIGRILTSLVPLESCESQRSNDAVFIKNEAMFTSFRAKLYFLCVFDKNAKIVKMCKNYKLARNEVNTASFLMKMASLER